MKRRYSRDDLLALAREEGLPASDRLITDWVQRGLLDRPQKESLGYARGFTEGTWPDVQARLWRSLLRKREELREQPGDNRIGPLCNLPIFTWFVRPDVPTRQVRKALASWLSAYRQASDRRARRTAKDLVADLVDPRSERRARDALIDAIADMGVTGRMDRPRLEDAFSRVIVRALALYRPKEYVDLVEARLVAATRLSDLTDQDFDDARREWLRWREPLVRHAARSNEFVIRNKTHLEYLLNNACLELLSLLGRSIATGK